MIVEDHKTWGYVLEEYLRMHGFIPQLETSAEAALKNAPPHLCLLDVSLPGTDGFELAKQIKIWHNEMQIIFLTAGGLKIDKLKGLMLQADDYLVKPVDEENSFLEFGQFLEDLMKRVKTLLLLTKLEALFLNLKSTSLDRTDIQRSLQRKKRLYY